jgi:hypothetical protein
MAAVPNYINAEGRTSQQPTTQSQAPSTSSQSKLTAAQTSALQQYGSEAVTALNSGDYASAWKDALASESAFGGSQSVNTAATDPLVAYMESGQGLKALDPTLKMSADQIQQYYDAFSSATGTNAKSGNGTGFNGNLVGKNPYGLWGTAADTTAGVNAQAAVNAKNEPGIADISNYLGAKPTKSFLGKYGMDIAALVATAVSFGVAAPALAGALAADGIASGLAAGAIAGGVMGGVNTLAVDAITGKPITAGGVLGGALGGAAGGGLTGLASGAINDATGLGSTISTGLAGAGIGAAKSALTGGNVGLGALTGGIGGAVQGSGLTGNISSGLTSAGVPSGLAGAVTNAGVNYAVGGATGLAAGALMGGSTQPTSTSGVSGAPTANNTQQNTAPGMQTTQQIPASIMQQGSATAAGGAAVQAPTGQAPTGQAPTGQTQGGGNFFTNGLQQGANGTVLQGGSMSGGGINSATSYLGQGTNGNMASTGIYGAAGGAAGLSAGQAATYTGGMSTDQTLAGTITGALPGVIQAGAGVYGSQNAADAMTNADNNAIATQQSTLGNINNIWGTQQQLGQGADTALGNALGTNGQPADYSGFENTPGYQFAVQQGTQAIQRQAASMGNAYTPNTAIAVGQYVTGAANQNYNQYIQNLMGAAGLGSTANAGIATPTYQTGANISTLQQNQGYAQASGVTGASNAIGGAFGANGVGTSLVGAAGRFLGGGGGGGGGTAGGGGGGAYNGGAPVGGDVNGGVDPNTGIPYDISNGPGPTSSGGMFDPNNTNFDIPTTDPNWNSVTDSNDTSIWNNWDSVTDTGASDVGGDAGDVFGNLFGGPP